MNSTERPRYVSERQRNGFRGRLSLSIGRPTQSTPPPQRRRSSRLMPKRRRASPRAGRPALLRRRAKTKGVADIVFVVDISGSMALVSMRSARTSRHSSTSQGGPNNAAPVRDWRGKVVGFRDIEAAQGEGLPWIMDNSFVTDANALKAQLAALDAAGGGDEPEVAARRALQGRVDGSDQRRTERGSRKVAISCAMRRAS